MEKLYFASDYMETAAPEIMEALAGLAGKKFTGYGSDVISESARRKVLAAAGAPEGEVYFLVGGTQTNATVIDTMLRPYEGVIAASTGHVSVHEAGAIEYGGHKVLTLPAKEGKIGAADIDGLAGTYWNDENHEHMVMPAMVYISQPTEYGTLYSLKELEEISAVCRKWKLALYVDGARLAYALSAKGNDVTLKDLSRLTDVFYIGGTKCGALLGEAVVFPKKGTVPHFFTMVKQHGALLAKGWAAGLQFDTLFTGSLYEKLGKKGDEMADRIRQALDEKGYVQDVRNSTNQIFITLTHEKARALSKKVEMGFWENKGDKVVMRIATSWASTEEETEKLIVLL
ncbi:aminotransferase class I/II-fold pyridoxal phosphate-dependent enzyme [uncultured Dialister sp.]|jgi:threonine aldolase|uniref:threonine aldolase family protein n=1 Tax=uncultured Dialister sp. TaxID=278064 RepID=UPI002622F167|nr:aminotransferase class I/II-fold pyridoxal phosphate-dependent enzyme [uncultured Dialister sp.]